MAIEITRMNLSAAELRRAAGRTRDAKASRRMLALALVLDGRSRTEAAESCGMDRQTLRDWVHRYNAEGLAGLSDRPLPGRAALLDAAQMGELAEIVETGPDPARDGVVRWRRIDLCAVVERRWGVRVAERTMGAILGRLGFTRLSARPRHPQGDPKRRSYIKNFADLAHAALPEAARDKPLEVWFQDEARVGQQGTLTRLWARRGTRPRAPKDCRYAWAYLFGAVCPARATGAALVMPYANTEAMSLHLAEIAKTIAPGAHALLVLDGAGWHGAKDLVVPANITLLPLPPYSPELNPVENVWQYLRQNRLANRVFDSYEAIVHACCEAWNALVVIPERVASITSRSWAEVNG